MLRSSQTVVIYRGARYKNTNGGRYHDTAAVAVLCDTTVSHVRVLSKNACRQLAGPQTDSEVASSRGVGARACVGADDELTVLILVLPGLFADLFALVFISAAGASGEDAWSSAHAPLPPAVLHTQHTACRH